jgi:hypothetical protein
VNRSDDNKSIRHFANLWNKIMSLGTWFAAPGFILLGWTIWSVAAESDAKTEKRAAPPAKWDQRVTKEFFPDAFKELKGTRPDYAASNGKSPPAAPPAGGNGGTTSGEASSGAFAWSKLISAETLQDEIKSHQPLLVADVKSKQVFLGGKFKEARDSFSMLAAAFAIINEFDKDARWKTQAAAARDLFARAGFNCKTATDQSFNEAKLRAQDLGALLQGETVAPPSNLEPKNQWDKVAQRAPLMKRLELAQQDKLAKWTANASDFKKNAAAAQHEAEIIAAIAELMTREGQTEDDAFSELAKSMQQSALQIIDAAKTGNAESARTAAGALQKSCTACHEGYRS